MSEQHDNSGTLGRNKRMREGKNDPPYAGQLKSVECPACNTRSDYWLNAWVKTNQQDKSSFFSLSVRPKTDTAAPSKPAPTPPPPAAEDDVPF